MTDIKLFLDLNLEQDNLYIETNDDIKVLYNVQGFMSDDDFVDSFSDIPKGTTLIANKKNILSSITQIDIDYILTFNVITYDETFTYIEEFNRDKLRNLNKINDKLYEVPLNSSEAIKSKDVAWYLAEEFYAISFEDVEFEFPGSMSTIFKFIYAEKERIYRSSILTNEVYDSFIEEINQFIKDYNVEFEQSEGTEL